MNPPRPEVGKHPGRGGCFIAAGIARHAGCSSPATLRPPPVRTVTRFCLTLCLFFTVLGHAGVSDPAEADARQTIAKALVTEDSEEQAELVRSFTDKPSTVAVQLLTAWKEGVIFLHESDAGEKTPIVLNDDKDAEEKQSARRFVDLEPLKDAAGKEIRLIAADLATAETDSTLRRAIKDVTDFVALSADDWRKRLAAAQAIGLEQDVEKLSILRERLEKESDSDVKRALREAIALAELRSEEPSERLAAASTLGELGSIPSQDVLKTVRDEAEAAEDKELAAAAAAALVRIESHVSTVNTLGTLFRGLSAGSVLLVVAIGLAITFGLMGVINMAHGELIVVGAYTTYIVQNVFAAGMELSPFGTHVRLPGLGLTGVAESTYFLVALPMSFLTAALVGIALERGIIRFLYKRPLESLLATWGVSLVMQQLFRLVFGANNVQVNSPLWLSGNWTLNDIVLGWNRVFVIGFAVLIVFLTWLTLNKTPLGLLIRSVMQNREMAACMGVRTERVNMLTFGFGSGLAGLAGAFLSQIGNVGPNLGQNYIVDSFMTVVVGGVGNIFGTVLSALGIGMVDQSLQQILGNPVLGKILVLGAIILFLQWRPAGLFVTRSRSLES